MEDIVQTKCSKTKKDLSENFVCVNYEAPRKKLKMQDKLKEEDEVSRSIHRSNVKNQSDEDVKQQQEKEMKKLRYDVIKFGTSGFNGAKAKKGKIALAVSLGARPPPNKNINYKVLQERRKQAKEAKKNREVSGLSQSLVKHKPKQKKSTGKKDKRGILDVYGKVQGKELSRNKKK